MSLPASPDDAVHAAIAVAVRGHRTRKVPITVILAAASSVDRSAASDAGWRRRVRSSIDRLAADGDVELPKTRWDRRTEPALPDYVLRPAPPHDYPEPAAPIVWHADLGWVPDAETVRPFTATERRLLVALNRWLPRRTGIVVPIRERSLLLLGDEKALEQMRRTSRLFADGYLTLSSLDCELCWPPVDHTVLGDGPWLVVENWTTYSTLTRAAVRDGWDGCLVYGSGMQVTTRIAALAEQRPAPASLLYFGDVDATGFSIARTAAATVHDLGLPPLRPALGMYRLLLERRIDRRANANANVDLIDWARAWLDGDLGDEVALLLAERVMVVQEAVGWETFASVTFTEALR